jgi:putative transposase
MPDHLHFLAEGSEEGCDLLRLVKSIKLKSSGHFAAQFGGILWQKGFYEHVLRADESLEDVAWYMWLNPVPKGIVKKPEDYPFSGSFTGMLDAFGVEQAGMATTVEIAA